MTETSLPPTETDTDVIVPRSVTYRLSRAEAAAVLVALGLEPDGRLLDPCGQVTEPLTVLRASGLVDDDDRVHPFLAAAMAVAARPGRTIHAIATVPGSGDWVDLLVGASATAGPYVTVDTDGGGVDLYAVETPMEIAAVLDDLFRLTAYPTHPIDPDVELSVPAWVGLLALADVRRLRRLRDDLRRGTDEASPMSVADLEGAITVGLDGGDSRWAVSAAVPVAPVPLRKRRVDPERAVRELVELGIIAGDTAAFEITPLGEHLAELAEHAVVVGSITLTYRGREREVRGGEMVVYRTPTRLAVGIWSGTAKAPRLILTEPVADGAVSMMSGLVGLAPARTPAEEGSTGVDRPPPAPPFSSTDRVGARGADLRAERDGHESLTRLPTGTAVRVLAHEQGWAEVVVESGARGWVVSDELAPAGVAGWTPTHRVGEGGTSVWQRPDPSEPVDSSLMQGTQVEVVEEAGVWALVRADDGREGWVDGRHLIVG